MIRFCMVVLLWFGGCIYPVGGVIETGNPVLIQEFYPCGQLRYEGYMLEGLETGYWRFYYSGGKLRKHGEYVYGLKEHWWEEYYDNGRLKMEGAYHEGKKVHYWIYYNRGGDLAERVFYVNGKQVVNHRQGTTPAR